MPRKNNRNNRDLRNYSIIRNFTNYPEGSVLIKAGNTHVLCNVRLINQVPQFMKGTGQGWVTAEYGMLPNSTHTRNYRESTQGKQSGRTQEIQRLIGRSLRAVIDTKSLGERTLYLDCDVLQADGSTRCASITGSWIAVTDAVNYLIKKGNIKHNIIRDSVAAVSVGMMQENMLIDLDYKEDSNCDVDVNVVMTGSGHFIELQGTAEGKKFRRSELNALLNLAQSGIYKLSQMQYQSLIK